MSNEAYMRINGRPMAVDPGRLTEYEQFKVPVDSGDVLLNDEKSVENMMRRQHVPTNEDYFEEYYNSDPDYVSERYGYLKSQGLADSQAYEYLADEWRNMTPQRRFGRKHSFAAGVADFGKWFTPGGSLVDFSYGDKEGLEDGINTFAFKTFGLPWMAVETLATTPAFMREKSNIERTNEGIRRNNQFATTAAMNGYMNMDLAAEIARLNAMGRGEDVEYHPSEGMWQEEYEVPSYLGNTVANAAQMFALSKLGNKINMTKAFNKQKKAGVILPKATKAQKDAAKKQNLLDDVVRRQQIKDLRVKQANEGLTQREQMQLDDLMNYWRR